IDQSQMREKKFFYPINLKTKIRILIKSTTNQTPRVFNKLKKIATLTPSLISDSMKMIDYN
ncbi:hypothetical protein DERP_014827, partial [Dermatophagoides pteronyssinus]